MARLGIAFVILLAIVSHVAAICEKKIISGKFGVISKESLAAANALRKVAIATPLHKIQLATIANDFAVSLNHAASSLGNIVVNFAESNAYDVLADGILVLSNTSYEIQQELSGNSEHLKEKLVALLEAVSQSALKNSNQFENVTNHFITTQVKKDLDFVIYGIYKLKYQAVYFEKTNKELIPEMKATLTQFTEKLNSMAPDNIGSEAKLRDALLLTSILTSRNAYKIGNWVEVNIETAGDLKSAEEVVDILGNIYLKEINAITQDRNELKIKDNFIKLYNIGFKLGKQLANLEYSDKTGGIELIRSSIFDVVTLGRAIVEGIEYLSVKS